MTWIGSPNFDTNRKPIDRIVIHWIVGNLASADAVFKKTDPGTSAHYAVEDNEIHQYVKEEHVAYHAGVYTMNQRSIGIEHSASPDRLASEETYKTSAKLIKEIAQRYNIPLDRTHIIKHSEVKATQCPGTMDIDKLIRMASEALGIEQIAEQLRLDRDRNWNLYSEQVELVKQKDERIVALEEELQAVRKERDEYIEANKTLNDKISNLAEAIKKDAVEDADVHVKLLDAEHEKASLAKEAQEFFMALINLFYKKKGR